MRPSTALTVAAHTVGWILFFGLVIGFSYTSSRDDSDTWTALFSPASVLFCFTYIVLFYLNGYLLVPALYLHRRYLLYFLIVAALFAAVFFLQPYDELIGHSARPFSPRPEPPHGFPPPRRLPPPRRGGGGGRKIDIISIILFFAVLAVSTALRIVRQWRLTERRAAQAEADKVNAELSSLKAQINPHFLFNTLNNIYALAVTKSENTPAAIMQLSRIMRYVTDDVRHDFVPLESEVDCLRHYVDLQRLRLNEKTTVDFSVTGDLTGKQIAPLVLLTFVENVFKYGISAHEPSPVTVKLDLTDTAIRFFSRNKIFGGQDVEESTGIGIKNTRQRLDYLYPGKYTLTHRTDNGFYTVELILQP